jgi:hypothetical protein
MISVSTRDREGDSLKLLLTAPALLLLTAWSVGCLWIDGPESRVIAGLLAAGFVLATLLDFAFVRPVWRLWAFFAVLFFGVQLWWIGIEPSNDREWLADVARPPVASFDGDLVTIRNVRNFTYRSETDFDEHWETRTYDLSKLVGVDMFLVYWGSPMIAHTIASWQFEEGPPLAISIETRKEVGESYSAVLGFFRQYELYYVAADEHDVIGVRASHRGEEVYLYRLETDPAAARAVLVDYLETMNRLADHPTWYNALTHNCTTTIRRHAKTVAPENPFSWKILVNGYIDELGYDRGTIDTSLPFEELKARSDVTEKAKAADDDPDFSQLIRKGLPGGASRRASGSTASG